jgi:signal transduction histidine kinase
LYPVLLEKFGLVVALNSLCRDFSQSGIAIDFVHEGCPPVIPRNVSVCIYRVVQESLNNISKHAKTKFAKVSLHGSPGVLELLVEDTGIGFDPELLSGSSGLGLASIEERVRRAGGRCSIRSTPGVGTEIRATCTYLCLSK